MLAYHVLIPVFCAVAMNVYIYKYRLNKRASENKYLPPGFIIGVIWTIIFALLGYVHYRLYKLDNRINFGSMSIVVFICFSLFYPVVNAINEKHGYFMNLISLILSFVLGVVVLDYSRNVFLYLIPLLTWVSFVNLIVLYNIIYLR
jgi:tryptophan-rich sensory protein